jgi:phosphoribosylanthranilate isomerase
MTTWVKICGLTERAAVDAALAAGTDAVGFVMFVPASPRNVAPDAFMELSKPARGRAKVVIVTADPTPYQIDRIVELKPDAIQLHGKEETPETLAALRAGFDPGREVWKGLPVSVREDLAAADRFTAAGRLLLDAKPPKGASRTGGHGAAFDWSILDGWRAPKPWILSGGLTPGAVADAIRRTGATAVDVSSGVEASPGQKDIGKIRAFITAAKSATPSGAAA